MDNYFLSFIFLFFSIIYFLLGYLLYSRMSKKYLSIVYFMLCFVISAFSLNNGLAYIFDYHASNTLKASGMIVTFALVAYICYAIIFNRDKKENTTFMYFPIFLFVFSFLILSSRSKYTKNLNFRYFFIFVLVLSLVSIVIFYSKFKFKSFKRFKLNKLDVISCSLILIFMYIYGFRYSYVRNDSFFESLSLIMFSIPLYFFNKIISDYVNINYISDEFLFKIMDNLNQGVIVDNSEEDVILENKSIKDIFDKSIRLRNINEVIFKNSIKKINSYKSDFNKAFLQKDDTSKEVVLKYKSLFNSENLIKNRIFIVQSMADIIQTKERLKKAKNKLDKSILKQKKDLEQKNSELEKQINERASVEYQIQDIFCYDTLTGLYNRAYFIQNLKQTIFEESGAIHALMFLDLDGFKVVNDSLGHSFGDDVIIEISNRLRVKYKYKNVIISRFGGDEFVILIKNISDVSIISEDAKEILDIVKQPIYFDSAKVRVTTSIGIAVYPQDGKDVEELIKNADTAMYKAKSADKGSYKFFEDSFRIDMQKEYELTRNLISAIDNEELLLFYQPQIAINEGTAKIVGFESLMRWKKDGVIVPPNSFIHIAEKTNIISEMGRWAIFEACNQCNIWNNELGSNLKIAINLSTNQLMNPMLYDEVSTALLQSGVNPSCIELEITESSIVKNIKHCISTLNLLKELGIRVSVDDFGTKYSTFNYIKYLPIDKIKIDISFIRGIGNSKIDEAIILSLISLSEELGIGLIAEGVENEEQLDFLVKNGCNNIQGFYFFKPMSVEDITEQNVFNYEKKINI